MAKKPKNHHILPPVVGVNGDEIRENIGFEGTDHAGKDQYLAVWGSGFARISGESEAKIEEISAKNGAKLAKKPDFSTENRKNNPLEQVRVAGGVSLTPLPAVLPEAEAVSDKKRRGVRVGWTARHGFKER